MAEWKIIVGDVREKLAEIPAGSVQFSMCSPPYWNLRDYGTGTWEGGEAVYSCEDCDIVLPISKIAGGCPQCGETMVPHDCDHVKTLKYGFRTGLANAANKCDGGNRKQENRKDETELIQQYRKTCPKCGAVRVDKQLGSEPTIEEFVETLVGVFDGVKRVLREDGVCVINLGDSFASSGGSGAPGGSSQRKGRKHQQSNLVGDNTSGLPPGNQCLVPHKFAIAMQEAGWILRETVIWAKAFSGQFKRGSCMPESLSGTRWERCRVKVKDCEWKSGGVKTGTRVTGRSVTEMGTLGMLAQWQPCPGCDRCTPNDGYVLRRGSWRHTSAFEYVYVFVKSMGNYADQEAVKEKADTAGQAGGFTMSDGAGRQAQAMGIKPSGNQLKENDSRYIRKPTRNPRNVLFIGTQAYKNAHFATYPEALVAHFVKAFTPDKGVCPSCLVPWARCVETTQLTRERPHDKTSRHEAGDGVNSCGNTVAGVSTKTIGWRPCCTCNAGGNPPRNKLNTVFMPC